MSDQLDYAYPGPEYAFHMRDFRPGTDWGGLDQSSLVSGHGGHSDQRSDLLKQSVVTVPSVCQDRGEGSRDEKYWERRRWVGY